jgi:hypothetical protein
MADEVKQGFDIHPSSDQTKNADLAKVQESLFLSAYDKPIYKGTPPFAPTKEEIDEIRKEGGILWGAKDFLPDSKGQAPEKGTIQELPTGDTFIRERDKQILVMPNGDKLTVNTANGDFDLNSKDRVHISRKNGETQVQYPNGDSVSFDENGIRMICRADHLVLVKNDPESKIGRPNVMPQSGQLEFQPLENGANSKSGDPSSNANSSEGNSVKQVPDTQGKTVWTPYEALQQAGK